MEQLRYELSKLKRNNGVSAEQVAPEVGDRMNRSKMSTEEIR